MTRYQSIDLFVVLATVWGSTSTAIKAELEFFPPVLLAALRYDVAGIVMLTYALYAADSPLPRGRAEWTEVVIGTVFLVAAYRALLSIGEADPIVTSAATAVTVSLSPVFMTGFARLLLPSERLAPLGVIGLLLGLVSIAVLSKLDPSSLPASGTVAKFLIFGAAATFTLDPVLAHRVDSELPIETMEAWSMPFGAGPTRVTSISLGERPEAVILNVQSVAALAYLSLAANALGFLIYFDPLARLGPIEINLVSYITPIFATLSGWVFLSEVPMPSTVGGLALIFLGLALLKRGVIRREFRYRFGDGAHATG